MAFPEGPGVSVPTRSSMRHGANGDVPPPEVILSYASICHCVWVSSPRQRRKSLGIKRAACLLQGSHVRQVLRWVVHRSLPRAKHDICLISMI